MNTKEVKQYINREFGFAFNKIILLEYSGYAWVYCMFKVCNITYQVNNNSLSIFEQE